MRILTFGYDICSDEYLMFLCLRGSLNKESRYSCRLDQFDHCITIADLAQNALQCNGNRVLPNLQMGVAVMGFVEDFRYGFYNSYNYIFCPIWNL